MTFNEFKLSLSQNSPPEKINDLLIALWYDAKAHASADEASWDKVPQNNSGYQREEMQHGFMLIFIAKKEIPVMLLTGTQEQENNFLIKLLKKNGKKLLRRC